MLQRVGAAILLAQSQWNPKTAKEPLERVIARAAFEAMREPTEAMLDSGGDTGSPSYGEQPGHPGMPSEVWDAMIRAALRD
jgi:hypothetical protein